MYGKLEDHFHLSNKKALFYNMRAYYLAVKGELSSSLPLTFHIKSLDDPEYQKFIECFNLIQLEDQSTPSNGNSVNKNIWIIKPGENTNRGLGIEVKNSLADIQQLMESYASKQRTAIL